MNRQTAILNAQIFRFKHITMDPLNGNQREYTTEGVFHSGPSISAAKRATRGQRCVVAKNSTDWASMARLAEGRKAAALAVLDKMEEAK